MIYNVIYVICMLLLLCYIWCMLMNNTALTITTIIKVNK